LIPKIYELPPGLVEFPMDSVSGGKGKIPIRKKEIYRVTQTVSKYDLKCIVVVPKSSMYELPDYLFRMYILYICLSLVAGISLSLYFANNSNKQIRTILAIFNSAKEGKFHVVENRMPVIKNSYQYILYNIINAFIEKDYLTTQLSERKYKARLDEMVALQSQMHPHFLFNTLQTINMKVLSLGKGPNEASYMIEHLSSILRYSMHDPSRFVRLEEEIAQARSYMAIQSIRYKDAIKVTWKYDEGILNFGTLRLLFQPLLENSIVHGMKEQEIPGEILIVLEEEQNYLSATVADTGAGIPEDALKKIRENLARQDDQFEHIGLYNTERRIKLAFGDAYGISIDSETGYGTIVQIKLPKFRFADPADSRRPLSPK
jgi:two-component system sensor histidine kinase YesM